MARKAAAPASDIKSSVRLFWKIFFGGMGFVVLLFTAANFGLLGKMPSLKELQNPEANLASEIYTSDGKLMGKYYAENRSEVKYHELSQDLIHALIATEDQNFYDHSGIDARAVARVVLKLGTDGGGSPITQQLAKMMLGQGGGNILKRSMEKIKEWIIAVKLERNFTKEEIITLYLNHAAWGNNYGIRNASKTYFQKEPKELNIEESAVLVGMLKGFIYDPIRRPAAALNRRNTVIQRMVDCKQQYLTQAQANKLKAKPLITNYKRPDENVGVAPYFRTVLADKMRKWCKDNINPKTGEPYDLYRDGLKIYTSIDSRMQQYAEEAVEKHQPVIQRKLNNVLKYNGDRMWKGRDAVMEQGMKTSERWKNLKEEGLEEAKIRKTFESPIKMRVFAWNEKHEMDTVMSPRDSIRYHKQLMQTSFVAMDPRTGEVKAWVGGIDFRWYKFDHVTAQRQVGSTFKPLLYTLAVQDAGYTPESYISGGPLTLNGKTITGGGGTMAYCLAKSLNAAAWHLMGMIGVKRTIEFAQQCGIHTKLPPYPSIALGAAEIPMLEMLQSYTMFPNKGYNMEPQLIQRIEDKNGNLLKEFVESTPKQVINEADAYTMVKLMTGVVKFGTGRSLNNYNIPAEKAGKTGTTNDNTDGWFIGYTPELLAGTWVGCDDPFIRIYAGTAGGSEMALPKWGYFMEKVYADKTLPYGKQLKFEEPPQLANDPIYADQNLERLVNSGENEALPEDMGSGDAQDFFNDPSASADDYSIPAEPKKDTGKTKPRTDVAPPPAKPTVPAADDKNKKPAAKPADRPRPASNDY